MLDYEEKVKDVKAQLFREALSGTRSAQILEVGMGTGPNMPFWGQEPVRYPALAHLLRVSIHCTCVIGMVLHGSENAWSVL